MNALVTDFKKPRRNLMLVAIAAIVAVNSVILIAPDFETRDFYGDLLGPITAGVAAGYALLIVYRQKISGIFGKAYGSLAIGLTLWLIAEVIWSYCTLVLQIEVPFPSLADVFWLAGYGPLSYHLLTMAKFYGRVKKHTLVIVSVATAIFTVAYVNSLIESSVLSGETAFLTLAISIAYPVMDAMLVIPVVLVLVNPVRGQLTSIPWIFLSWLLMTTADAMFGHTAVANIAGEITIWNLFYNAAYICMTAGLYWYNKYFIFDEKKLTTAWLTANK